LLSSSPIPTGSLPQPTQPQPAALTTLPPSALTHSTVSKPGPLPSVEAFNSQLSIGGKDEALRKAASSFKHASESLERGRQNSEQYWSNALKIRRANWGLIPAPLPFGANTGRGADRTSKDFLVSFGLEESPSHFRRRAIAFMSSEADYKELSFPSSSHTRMQVSLHTTGSAGEKKVSRSTVLFADNKSIESSLEAAQREVFEEEILSAITQEASNLPTTAARVSERLIAIDAAQGIELRFTLVDSEDIEQTGTTKSEEDELSAAICDLISSVLQAQLLAAHSHRKQHRIGLTHLSRPMTKGPAVLQPIIDFLQYQVFCDRVYGELAKLQKALTRAGIPVALRFEPIGESGAQLIEQVLVEDGQQKVGGEAILRIDQRQTLRFTFLSPSTLTSHLPLATLPIASIPQLTQLLMDEVEKFLLNKMCDAGTQASESVNGAWFVDPVSGKTVGRWDGCILYFRVFFGSDLTVQSTAVRLDKVSGTQTTGTDIYKSDTSSLVSWLHSVVENSITQS